MTGRDSVISAQGEFGGELSEAMWFSLFPAMGWEGGTREFAVDVCVFLFLVLWESVEGCGLRVWSHWMDYGFNEIMSFIIQVFVNYKKYELQIYDIKTQLILNYKFELSEGIYFFYLNI